MSLRRKRRRSTIALGLYSRLESQAKSNGNVWQRHRRRLGLTAMLPCKKRENSAVKRRVVMKQAACLEKS
jgi:hypothetical protein